MGSNFTVSCMLCGRPSGQLRENHFFRHSSAPPLERRGGRARCGFCGGNLYLEADDSAMGALPSLEAIAKLDRLAS